MAATGSKMLSKFKFFQFESLISSLINKIKIILIYICIGYFMPFEPVLCYFEKKQDGYLK